MKNTIYFINKQKKVKITKEIKEIIKECINATLNFENFSLYAEVSVCFVDNNAIKELNGEYRNKDKPTDVLSFPTGDKDNIDVNILTGEAVLGDIVISLEKAMEQALEYGHTFEREIAFLTVHSCLHLLGYDHLSEDEEKIMFKQQDDILKAMGILR